MATTNINLRLNGVPRRGAGPHRLRCSRASTSGTEGQFGVSRLELTGANGVFGSATGQFAVMSGGVIEARYQRATENPSLSRAELTAEERVIMARADAALRHERAFI